MTVNEIVEKLYDLKFVDPDNFQTVCLSLARDIVDMHDREMLTDKEIDQVIVSEVCHANDKLFWEVQQAIKRVGEANNIRPIDDDDSVRAPA